MPPNPPSSEISAPLVLTIRNMGPVPSKKNRKVISKNRKTGKMFLRTDDDEAAWAKAAILDLLSQLNCAYRAAVAMQITPSAPSWIASSVPVTDSTKHIRRLSVDVVDVPEGQEGAVITISQIGEPTAAELIAGFAAAYSEIQRENAEAQKK